MLDVLTDDELKKETKNEGKNDAISSIIKACKQLTLKIPKQDELIKQLEIFRLKMLLRYVSNIIIMSILLFKNNNFFLFLDYCKYLLSMGK